MRTLRFALFAAFAPAVLAAQSEGVATFTIQTGGDDVHGLRGSSKLSFSRSAIRVDSKMDLSPAGTEKRERPGTPASYDMSMIQKLSEPDKTYMINDRTKSYSVMELAKNSPGNRSGETWTMKRLGKSRVAGVACDSATLTSSKGTVIETCVATDIVGSTAWWSAMNRRAGSDTWFQSMVDAGLKGLPIRMRIRNAEGKTGLEMELTSLERRPVPATTFQIPAGYTRTTPEAVNLAPENQKIMNDVMSHMTPEQRKAYEEAIRKARENPH